MINVYLAGKISNNPNYKKEFKEGKELIKKIHGDNAVILDPSILPAGLTQKEYMTICMSMINCCDRLYLLSNYKDSPGALVEKAYAEKVGISITVMDWEE